jgi:hypothetical protein
MCGRLHWCEESDLTRSLDHLTTSSFVIIVIESVLAIYHACVIEVVMYDRNHV